MRVKCRANVGCRRTKSVARGAIFTPDFTYYRKVFLRVLPKEVLFVLSRGNRLHQKHRKVRIGLRHRAHARASRPSRRARQTSEIRAYRGHKRQRLGQRISHVNSQRGGLQGGDIQFALGILLQRKMAHKRATAFGRRRGKVSHRSERVHRKRANFAKRFRHIRV